MLGKALGNACVAALCNCLRLFTIEFNGRVLMRVLSSEDFPFTQRKCGRSCVEHCVKDSTRMMFEHVRSFPIKIHGYSSLRVDNHAATGVVHENIKIVAGNYYF